MIELNINGEKVTIDFEKWSHEREFMEKRNRELMAYWHNAYNPDPKRNIKVK